MDRNMIRFQAKCQAILDRVKMEIGYEESPKRHAPDKIGGTDEPSEGQAMGSERADEGES